MLPNCLDWQLAPRFFWISACLLAGLGLMWRDWRVKGDWRVAALDLLLLAWYGLNVASIFWAFRWSEAVFYTQKVLLFVLCYWFVGQCLYQNETLLRRTLFRATFWLTVVAGSVIAWEVFASIAEHGLDNQHLYDKVRMLYGNKSLSTDFLFFLLVLNVFFYREQQKKGLFWGICLALLLLILLLQTRTVYAATALAGLVLGGLTLLQRPALVSALRQYRLHLALLMLVLVAGGYGLSRLGGSLAERLNPATYLDSGTALERRFVWYKTNLLNQENFWLGVGNGTWKFKLPSQSLQGGYRLENLQVAFTRAHNDYLEIRAEMGILGGLLFCALFVWAFWSAGRAWAKDKDPAHRQDLAVLMAGMAGYCVIQYFDFPRERMEMQVWLALVLAFVRFYSLRPSINEQPSFMDKISGHTGLQIGPRGRLLFGLAAFAGLAFCLLIGWQRINGELHNIRMLEAANQRDYRRTIRESQAALNPFYEYDDVTIPLPWFEGSAWFAMEQFEPAALAFERAYHMNPWNYQVLNNYATALVKAAKPGDDAPIKKAIGLYEEAVRINPRHDDSKFNLVYALYEVGEYTKALEWVERVDTVANPKTPAELEQNRSLKEKQQEYRKAVQAKMNE